MKRIAMFSAGALLLTTVAEAVPPAPPPPKEIQQIERLVGKWSATGTIKEGAAPFQVKFSWDCHRISGDYGVTCNAEILGIPDMPVYRETDLFGYDPGGKKIHWFSVTNAGETHDHQAAPASGNKMSFVYNGIQKSKPFKEVVDITFGDNATSMHLVAETFLEGRSTSFVELKGKKS